MQAAVLYNAHDFRIEELPDPVPSDDEYLIRVNACGVCHSEIHQWDKKIKGLNYPRYIGHEVSGEIIYAGKNTGKFRKGDRIAAWADSKGYSELIVLKEKFLFPVADKIPLDLALAEPISCTTNGIIKTGIQLQDTVALVGTGFMGLILLQQVKNSGAKKIIAVDVRDRMLALAARLGADIIINPLKKDYKKEINSLTGNKGVDVCFEVGGNEACLLYTSRCV